MTTIVKKYFCDICHEEVSKIKKLQVPVCFHTCHDDNILIDRSLEVCERCLPKVVVVHIHEDAPLNENVSRFDDISFEYPNLKDSPLGDFRDDPIGGFYDD